MKTLGFGPRERRSNRWRGTIYCPLDQLVASPVSETGGSSFEPRVGNHYWKVKQASACPSLLRSGCWLKTSMWIKTTAFRHTLSCGSMKKQLLHRIYGVYPTGCNSRMKFRRWAELARNIMQCLTDTKMCRINILVSGVGIMVVLQPSKLAIGVRFPYPAPKFGSVAQWTRAAGFYPVGWGFESLRDRQIILWYAAVNPRGV